MSASSFCWGKMILRRRHPHVDRQVTDPGAASNRNVEYLGYIMSERRTLAIQDTKRFMKRDRSVWSCALATSASLSWLVLRAQVTWADPHLGFR
jgi:hypothetical protein